MTDQIRAVVAGPVPPIPGGIAQHTANLADALRGAGCTVQVVSWAAQYPRRFYPGTLLAADADFGPGVEPSLHWARPWSWRSAGRRARVADILVVPWVTPIQAPAIGTMIRAARPTPTAVLVHNAVPHESRPFDDPLTRWALRHVAGAVVHTDAVAADARRIAGIQRVRIVPHPPNLAIDAHPLPGTPPLRCLFLGIVRQYKGVDLAIRAVRGALDSGVDVTLTIAGEFWDDVDDYRRIVADLGLDAHVDIRPGYVPDDRLETLLAEHHVVVAPYRTATQSGVLPIALSAQRPVVTTRIKGLTDAVDEGENALVAEPGDAADLARCLVEAAGSLDVLHAGAVRASAAAPRWEDVAKALLEVASVAGAQPISGTS